VTADAGNTANSGVSLPPIAEFRHSNQSQGIGIAFDGIYATGYNTNQAVVIRPKGSSEVQITGTAIAGSGYGNLLIDYPNTGSAGGAVTIRNSNGGLNAFASLLFEIDGSTSCTSSTTPVGFTQANGMLYCLNTGGPGNNASRMGFIQWNGGSEVETMTLLPTGQVSIPGKYYAAGYLSGGTAAGNYIDLYTTQTQGGMAVTTSNKLVAPIAGLYSFGYQTIMATTTGRNDTFIRLNGGDLVRALSEDNGTGYHQRGNHMCYYLNANDYIQFFCSSGTIYGGTPSNDYNWRMWYFYHVA
jgi:hypothetical protein